MHEMVNDRHHILDYIPVEKLQRKRFPLGFQSNALKCFITPMKFQNSMQTNGT